MALPNLSNCGWQVGQVEADPLIVNGATGEVYVDDLTSPGRKLWICSDSFEHFLLALIPVARYLGKCLVDASVLDDKALCNQILSESVIGAGGDNYAAFYRMLLGAR